MIKFCFILKLIKTKEPRIPSFHEEFFLLSYDHTSQPGLSIFLEGLHCGSYVKPKVCYVVMLMSRRSSFLLMEFLPSEHIVTIHFLRTPLILKLPKSFEWCKVYLEEEKIFLRRIQEFFVLEICLDGIRTRRTGPILIQDAWIVSSASNANMMRAHLLALDNRNIYSLFFYWKDMSSFTHWIYIKLTYIIHYLFTPF